MKAILANAFLENDTEYHSVNHELLAIAPVLLQEKHMAHAAQNE